MNTAAAPLKTPTKSGLPSPFRSLSEMTRSRHLGSRRWQPMQRCRHRSSGARSRRPSSSRSRHGRRLHAARKRAPSRASDSAARARPAGPPPPGTRRAPSPVRSRPPARRHRAPRPGTGAGSRPDTAPPPLAGPLGQHPAAQIIRGLLERRYVDRGQVAQRRVPVAGGLLHEPQLVSRGRRCGLAREPLHQRPQRPQRQPRVACRPCGIRLAEQGLRGHFHGRGERGRLGRQGRLGA